MQNCSPYYSVFEEIDHYALTMVRQYFSGFPRMEGFETLEDVYLPLLAFQSLPDMDDASHASASRAASLVGRPEKSIRQAVAAACVTTRGGLAAAASCRSLLR